MSDLKRAVPVKTRRIRRIHAFEEQETQIEHDGAYEAVIGEFFTDEPDGDDVVIPYERLKLAVKYLLAGDTGAACDLLRFFECERCHGEGVVTKVDGDLEVTGRCPQCDGFKYEFCPEPRRAPLPEPDRAAIDRWRERQQKLEIPDAG